MNPVTNQNCQECRRLYKKGSLIATDFAYWRHDRGKVLCPECQGIDVEAEMNRLADEINSR